MNWQEEYGDVPGKTEDSNGFGAYEAIQAGDYYDYGNDEYYDYYRQYPSHIQEIQVGPADLSSTICESVQTILLRPRVECEESLKRDDQIPDTNGTYCRGEFDNYICWPHGIPGSFTKAPCSTSYESIDSELKFGYRFCHLNGSWMQSHDITKNEMVTWSHTGDCDVTLSNSNNAPLYEQENTYEITLLKNFKIIYSIGCGVSLVCLIIALLLLAFFKKLHCTRNYIHMNLMVSLIIRYTVIFVKDTVLTSQYGLEELNQALQNMNYDFLQKYCDTHGEEQWATCRLAVTLMHYALTANYYWLLVEGLYLQVLLVFVMSENKCFAGFMMFGWAGPWMSVLIWVVLRSTYDGKGCWDTNDKYSFWWIIKAPIIVSIVINFTIFVNVVRIIVSKLQARNMTRSDSKMRLARSTLALIPLLGIHYFMFLVPTQKITNYKTVQHLYLLLQLIVTSMQGTLISVLYCFINGEVRIEVGKAWRDWQTSKELAKDGPNPKKSHQTTSASTFSRHSASGSDYTLLSDVKIQAMLGTDFKVKMNYTTMQKEWRTKESQNNRLDFQHFCMLIHDDKYENVCK